MERCSPRQFLAARRWHECGACCALPRRRAQTSDTTSPAEPGSLSRSGGPGRVGSCRTHRTRPVRPLQSWTVSRVLQRLSALRLGGTHSNRATHSQSRGTVRTEGFKALSTLPAPPRSTWIRCRVSEQAQGRRCTDEPVIEPDEPVMEGTRRPSYAIQTVRAQKKARTQPDSSPRHRRTSRRAAHPLPIPEP